MISMCDKMLLNRFVEFAFKCLTGFESSTVITSIAISNANLTKQLFLFWISANRVQKIRPKYGKINLKLDFWAISPNVLICVGMDGMLIGGDGARLNYAWFQRNWSDWKGVRFVSRKFLCFNSKIIVTLQRITGRFSC